MMDLKQMIGNEGTLDYVRRALAGHKISHAYLIDGEDGSGKMTLAKAFARALLCTAAGHVDACGHCQSCLQFDGGNHPDVIYVSHEKPALISVAEVREQIVETVEIKPYESAYKIYIVDEADKMNEQAQNALLKTLEEPPEYIVMMLLTDNLSRILPTIRSRSAGISMKPVSVPDIETYLETRKQIPEDTARLAAQFSQGNVGRAIRFASSDTFTQRREGIIQILRTLQEMTMQEQLYSVKELSEQKTDITDCLDFMILWYRDVLMFKVTRDANQLLYKDQLKYISRQASQISYEGAENCLAAIEKAKVRLKANVNFDLTMELMLLTLRENGIS